MLTSKSQPILVGIVASLVGFTSSFAVVLAGLETVGATPAQAATGLMALNIVQGVLNMFFSFIHKKPFMTAWSTPGAAVLITVAAVEGGWPAAVGAFLITGLLIVMTGLWPLLGKIIALIPPAVAQAMLAGVLLIICVAPFQALALNPLFVAPLIIGWLILMRIAPRWATPVAFLGALFMAIGTVILSDTATFVLQPLNLVPTLPTFNVSALVSVAIPLYVVTMASQNIPGVAVMKSYGYEVPWRQSLLLTGSGTLITAPFGGHALNLAAITAALTASKEAHPDQNKRWIAAFSAGCGYVLLGILTPFVTAVVTVSPEGVVETVAGLALISTLGAAIAEAFKVPRQRITTGLTFVIAASPIAIFGVGAAFWALIVGIISWAIFRE